MTCIIGMYYNSSQGAIVIADSRTMVGGDFLRSKKLFELEEGIVFAASGLSGIAEKLVPNVEDARKRLRRSLPSEIVDIFEDEMAELYNRYKMTKPYRFSNDDNLLNGIIGFLDDDKPQLHCLFENGYAESLHDYHAIGHGARHASNILRTLYNPTLSKDRAIEIGVHALVEVSKIDAMVDSCPQIAILESAASAQGLTILNSTGQGFEYNLPTVSTILKKLEGIEEKRSQALHLLLDGSEEVKRKFDEALKQYESSKKQSEETEPAGPGQGSRAKGATAT